MASTCRLGILSDIHYASPAEKERGGNYESACIPNPLLRLSVRLYRRFFWLHEPLQKNYLLGRFIEQSGGLDYVIANGDYSCDSMFVGVSDDAACQSVRECLDKLRTEFGERLRVNFGDHELGKVSFFGGRGGMRLASWHRAQDGLGLSPFWQLTIGRYVLIGVVSSLVALPVFKSDTLAGEYSEWERLRAIHLAEVNKAFRALASDQRVLLFCHDPTALPFLGEEPAVQSKLSQIEQTIIGHLHSNLVLWKSRWLAGMPRISFLGHTAKRLSTALSRGKYWKPFRVRLCPSLAGIELLKDGGYLTAELDPDAQRPLRVYRHYLLR
jgi:hypothetical protein